MLSASRTIDPAHAGLPARLEHHRARDVAPAGGDVHVRRARPGSRRHRDRGSPRTRSASPSAAGTSTRRSRWARPARSSRSRTGTRSRRSAETRSSASLDRFEPPTSRARFCCGSRRRVKVSSPGHRRPDSRSARSDTALFDRRHRLGAGARHAGSRPDELTGRRGHADVERHRQRRRRRGGARCRALGSAGARPPPARRAARRAGTTDRSRSSRATAFSPPSTAPTPAFTPRSTCSARSPAPRRTIRRWRSASGCTRAS